MDLRAMAEEPVKEGSEQPENALSVSGALNLAKQNLESVVVTIIGEVSEVSVKSGYKAAYFTLKDDSASLPCMMWNNRYKALGFDLAVGQLVQVVGRFSLYVAKGRMNFDVFSVSLSGEGELRLRVDNLAKKLRAEGLIAQERRRALPELPAKIGLVTSPRGAAVHDVLRTLRRRFPLSEVYLAGVPVEGPTAAAGIADALAAVIDAGAEVVLMVRGGGSFEDLMPFNDEALARAIAASPVPVVTGIGHEVDTTIADMVSDLRASTPTAAAEAVSPAPEALEALLNQRAQGLQNALGRRLERTRQYLERIAEKAIFKDTMMLFAADAQWLDLTAERLSHCLPNRLASLGQSQDALKGRLERLGPVMLERFRFGVASKASRLADLSPVNTLARGYSIARDGGGAIISQVGAVVPGEPITLTLSDGTLGCVVESVDETMPFSVVKKGTADD